MTEHRDEGRVVPGVLARLAGERAVGLFGAVPRVDYPVYTTAIGVPPVNGLRSAVISNESQTNYGAEIGLTLRF